MSPPRMLSGVEAVVLLLVVGLGVGLWIPALRRKAKTVPLTMRCGNNLRQLGMAAIQYADDKRFFPHVNRILELDGGVTSSDTPRALRSLVWYGYHDSPERFICPASSDEPAPGAETAGEAWTWGGGRTLLGPFDAGAYDPPLDQLTDLSYGYMRRGWNSNVRCTAPLAADRAVAETRWRHEADPLTGNHLNGWNVVYTDARVEFYELGFKVDGVVPAGAYLTSTSRGGGYLALKVQDDAAVLRRRGE